MSWGGEKLPLDLLQLVLQHLYARHCPFCDKPFIYEICNPACRAFTAVCRRWRRAYKRAIVLDLRNSNFRFCVRPKECLSRYIAGSGRIPFLILVNDPRRAVRAQQAEGGHPGVGNDELSALNKARR